MVNMPIALPEPMKSFNDAQVGQGQYIAASEFIQALVREAQKSQRLSGNRAFSNDLLPKSTVWEYFVAWQRDGTWQKLVDALRGQVRTEAGREETPSAAVLAKVTTAKYPRLTKIFADNKYHNQTLQGWMAEHHVPYAIDIAMKPAGEPGFKPVKIRWVVEQAHACHGRCRRLSKDYERLTSPSATWIQVSAIQRMLRRLRPDANNRQAEFKYPSKLKKSA